MSTLISIGNGIYQRHQGNCPKVNAGSRCRCRYGFPKYVAKAGRRENGAMKIQERTFPTQRQAELWLADRRRQKREGTLSALDRTVGSYLNEYEEELESGRAKSRSGTPLKPGSVTEYLKALKVLRSEAGDLLARPVDLVAPRDIQVAVDRIAGTRAGRTVEKVITPLRTIFNRLERLGVISSSPMTKVVVPRDPPRMFAHEDVDPKAVYRTIQTLTPRERAFLSTCLLAGMRPSEVQALRWCDVDHEVGVINIHRGYSGSTLTTPKTTAGTRRVALLDALRGEFEDWKQWVSDNRPILWMSDQALIFARESDPLTPVTMVTVKQHARKQVPPEEWERIKPRSCRQVWVSANVSGGVDLVESMRSTGHTSVKVHLDTYGRQTVGKSDVVRAVVGEQFGSRILSHDGAEIEAWEFWQETLDWQNEQASAAAEVQGGGTVPRVAPLFDL